MADKLMENRQINSEVASFENPPIIMQLIDTLSRASPCRPD